jgi:hypothetical protein
MSEESKSKKAYKWLTEHLTSKGIGSVWVKVIAGAVIGILTAVGILTSCSNITPTQIHSVHELYHDVTGKSCNFEVEETTK